MALQYYSNFSPDACRILDVDESIVHVRFRNLELRIRFWPEPFAEWRENTSNHWSSADCYAAQLLDHWLSIRPTPNASAQGVFPFDLYTEDRHPIWSLERIAELSIRQIPPSIRYFLEQTRGSSWRLLLLAGTSREVADLTQSNPMLFKIWLDQENDPVRHLSRNALVNVLKPQPAQLKVLLLPGEQWWAKLLRKIPLEETQYLSLPDLQILAQSIDSRHAQYLRHADQISAYEVKAISGAARMDSLGRKWDAADFKVFATLTINALRTTPKPVKLKLPKFLKEFLRKTEQLAFEDCTPLQRIGLKNWRSELPFRCPAGWQHLDSVEKIIREGNAQKNCLITPDFYLEENIYLFRITEPVRATACVKRDDSNKFTLTECEGLKNTALDWQHMLRIRLALNEATAESYLA